MSVLSIRGDTGRAKQDLDGRLDRVCRFAYLLFAIVLDRTVDEGTDQSLFDMRHAT